MSITFDTYVLDELNRCGDYDSICWVITVTGQRFRANLTE